MNELQLTIDRAISKGWIPTSDGPKVSEKINALASKYGFNANDFAIFTHIESYGMNPKADKIPGSNNSCVGVIQFCSNQGTPGVKTIGGRNYNIRSILNMSLLQQLDLVDDYFNDVIPPNHRNGMTLGKLYFFVLYPAIGQQYDSYSDDTDLRGKVGTQASDFYNANGTLTKASVVKGLIKRAQSNLNSPVEASAGGGQGTSTGTTSSVSTSAADLGGPISTGASLGVCSELFPVHFTLEESLFYPGCFSRSVGNSMGGADNLSYPANGMSINGGSNFNISDFDPTVQICNGCLGFPFKKDIKITSPFCQRRISKTTGNVYYHSGTDYGASIGTEVIAVADGTVISPLIAGDGYGPGFVDIQHEKLGGLVSRSAHVIPKVRPGDKITQGDVIATIGNYPSGGPHLHLELRKDKGAGGSSKSVEECKTKFLDPALFCRKS